MKSLFQKALLIALMGLSACGSLQPSEPSSNVSEIDSNPLELNFKAEVNSLQYRTLKFSNTRKQDVTINNLAFVNNVCGAFSVFQIYDTNNKLAYESGEAIDVPVVSGTTVSVVLRFEPKPCATRQYTTTFLVYSTDGATTFSENISLVANVEDSSVSIVCDDEEEKFYNDELGDPTPPRTLPAGQYFLKVERMRAYIQTTGGFASQATKVGTDVKTEFVPLADRFKPVYLPFTTDDAGNLVLETVDECDGFKIPSPTSDPYFIGAPVILTTPSEMRGTIERSAPGHVGEVTLKDFTVRLFSNINNGDSLVQDDEGNFAVNIVMDLTTTDTEANPYLKGVSEKEFDDFGAPLLPIIADGEDSYLNGSDLYRGSGRFVAIGLFEGTDAKLSEDTAKPALLENQAYIFIEIVARVVTEKTL